MQPNPPRQAFSSHHFSPRPSSLSPPRPISPPSRLSFSLAFFIATFFLLTHPQIQSTHASVYPTKPVAGTTYIAGQAGQVEWLDDGIKPLLGAMGKMRIDLYARNNTFIATLARDIQPMALHTTVLIPPITPPNNHQYTMRFITIDPALTIYTANFAIMPNPLILHTPAPAPVAITTTTLMAQVSMLQASGQAPPVRTPLAGGGAGAGGVVPLANRPGIVTMSRYGAAPASAGFPYPTPITPSPVLPNDVNAPGYPDDLSQTNNAAALGSVWPFRAPRIMAKLTEIGSNCVDGKNTRTRRCLDLNVHGTREANGMLDDRRVADDSEKGIKAGVMQRVQVLSRVRREGRVDVEKIKFRMVFILWPAMVGLTLAF
ncbi:hypothetical protein CVT24_006519 [Panaeolus cyanescens]|uniref:Uncharacterized protein n=1 Tax=Panaeolus cyanescens TaxID=181874 RepID=A0A409WZB8_9AGAR|nr:hypothetical protein CVT24_006519 [Panaeolus cyanescens]